MSNVLEWIAKANACRKLNLYYQASKYANLALATEPKNTLARIVVGALHLNKGELHHALSSALSVLQIAEREPKSFLGDRAQDVTDAHLLAAKALTGLGEPEKARQQYAYLDAQENTDQVKWDIALNDLHCGDWVRGWSLYEKRLTTHSNRILHIYPFALTHWDGQLDRNSHVLVHGEQGLGDELMFAGYFELLVRRAKTVGATIYLAASEPTFKLFANTFPDVVHFLHNRGPNDVDAWEAGFQPDFLKSLPPGTMHVPFGSLPTVMGGLIPLQEPYFKYPQKEREGFAQALKMALPEARSKNLKVGLAWCANQRTSFGKSKSIPLEMFAEISHLPGIELVGLQSPEFGGDAKKHPNVKMVDFNTQLTNMNQVAGLMGNLDMVVTIDTSYCHLAGALGVPTQVLLKKDHDWRFGLHKQNPFYPCVHAIRQERLGDWDGPLATLKELLGIKIKQQQTLGDTKVDLLEAKTTSFDEPMLRGSVRSFAATINSNSNFQHNQFNQSNSISEIA